MRLLHTAVAVILWFALAGTPAHAVTAGDLAAHRAMYDLRLASAHSGDVSAASGNMAYEVQDACDGWAVRQRLRMTVTNQDGQDIEMVSDYTTWESKDGLRLRFRMRQSTDQKVTSDVAGDASLNGPGLAGTAHYTSPEDVTKELPKGTLFPMAHTAALLTAAEAGKRFIAIPLFDGTTANGAQDSFITVTKWNGPQEGKWPALSKLPSGRMHVAFFDRDATSQEPDYEVGMRYWENCVADDLAMDFGDFVMAGKLTEFRLLPHGC
jgi:hypothetical protein